jgi:hypothetical protein
VSAPPLPVRARQLESGGPMCCVSAMKSIIDMDLSSVPLR